MLEFARFVFLSVALWALFMSIRKALRMTGVIPYPPFKSRKEYLEAALEMDLGEFIERAKVTPRSVIEKIPVFDPKEVVILSAHLPASGSRKMTPEEVRIMSAQLSAYPGDYSNCPPATQPKSQVGKWFRTKSRGLLVRYRGPHHLTEWAIYETPSECLIHPTDVEPAYPMKGEWWDKLRCAQTHLPPGHGFILGVQNWGSSDRESMEAVKCGCLVPYNFGKGEEKKSGVGGSAGASGAGGGPGSAGPGGAGGAGGAAGVGVAAACASQGEDFTTTLNKMINKFSRGLEEAVALKRIEAEKPYRQPKKWYRLKATGELVRACSCQEKACTYYDTFKISLMSQYPFTEVEPAIPRAGEWWRWTASSGQDRGSFVWNLESELLDSARRQAVQDGLLEPINYGKGI